MTLLLMPVLLIFPFSVRVAFVAPVAKIFTPALAAVLAVVRAKFLSEISSADPCQRTSFAPLVPEEELIVMVPLVPIELLDPAMPSLFTYKEPELETFTPPPKELLVPVR